VLDAGIDGVNHAVPFAQDSLDSTVRLRETWLDSTGTPQMDVSTWLRNLGLEEYVQVFQANHIDAEVLQRLKADDLTALGITSVGHRRRLLDDALAQVNRTGERWFEAELHRLLGALLLTTPERDPLGAEACFQRALAVARGQEARLWELRAATSLARLWAEQGRRAEGHDLLAPIYGWFTEGFDTADLKDAKALLKDLA